MLTFKSTGKPAKIYYTTPDTKYMPAKMMYGENMATGYDMITETGETVTLLGDYNKGLVSLQINGKSTQDGTPTPENPVEVKSTGTLITDESDENYGKYNISVVSRGKNLFDISKVITAGKVTNNGNGSLTVSGGATSAGGVATLQAYCPDLKVGDVVTLNAVATADIEIPQSFRRIYIYGIKMAWRFGTSKTITQGMLTGGRVGWYYAGQDESGKPIPATISNIQIEYGTTATEYEPYIPPVTTNIYLDEPLRGIGNYRDYIDFKNGKVVRRIGVMTLDGDESTLYTFTSTRPQAGYSYYKYMFSVAQGTYACLCDKIPYKEYGYSVATSGTCIAFDSSKRNLIFKIPTEWASTLDEFKAWLAANPCTVYHVMGTKTETVLPDSMREELLNINTEYGKTKTLTVTGTDMTVEQCKLNTQDS